MSKRFTLVLAILALGLYSSAMAQDFNAGSSIMNTGSSYSSTIYGVGATGIDPMATTAGAPNRGRRATMDDNQDEESTWGDVGDYTPIGSPYIMLVFAAAAAGVIALRRRKQA